MNKWQVTIEVWPHSTGNGREADQKACGDRTLVFEVGGDTMRDAFGRAELIRMGIETNPMVWQAPITKIAQKTA